LFNAVVETPFTGNTDDTVQINPAVVVTNSFKGAGVTNRPTAADFNSSVVVVDCFMESAVRRGQGLLVGIGKPILNILV